MRLLYCDPTEEKKEGGWGGTNRFPLVSTLLGKRICQIEGTAGSPLSKKLNVFLNKLVH